MGNTKIGSSIPNTSMTVTTQNQASSPPPAKESQQSNTSEDPQRTAKAMKQLGTENTVHMNTTANMFRKKVDEALVNTSKARKLGEAIDQMKRGQTMLEGVATYSIENDPEGVKLLIAAENALSSPKSPDEKVRVLANLRKEFGDGASWIFFYGRNKDVIDRELAPFGSRTFEGFERHRPQGESLDRALTNWEKMTPEQRYQARENAMKPHLVWEEPTQIEIEQKKQDRTESTGSRYDPRNSDFYKGATADERQRQRDLVKEDARNNQTMDRISSVEQSGPFGLAGRVLGRIVDEVAGTSGNEDGFAAVGSLADSVDVQSLASTAKIQPKAVTKGKGVESGKITKKESGKDKTPRVMNNSGPPHSASEAQARDRARELQTRVEERLGQLDPATLTVIADALEDEGLNIVRGSPQERRGLIREIREALLKSKHPNIANLVGEEIINDLRELRSIREDVANLRRTPPHDPWMLP